MLHLLGGESLAQRLCWRVLTHTETHNLVEKLVLSSSGVLRFEGANPEELLIRCSLKHGRRVAESQEQEYAVKECRLKSIRRCQGVLRV